MRLEHFDEAFVLGAILLQALELVAREPNAPAGVYLSPLMVARDSLLTSMRSSVSAPTMPWRPAYTLRDLLRLHRRFDHARGRSN
mgnify:CR=1 FL=1